jgi:hypothetical protein
MFAAAATHTFASACISNTTLYRIPFLTYTPTRALFVYVCCRYCRYCRCCCQSLDPAKYPLPEPYPYKEAAAFFAEPDVTPADQLPPLKWSAPDEEGLLAFLVGE